jgi:hypothetical protein
LGLIQRISALVNYFLIVFLGTVGSAFTVMSLLWSLGVMVVHSKTQPGSIARLGMVAALLGLGLIALYFVLGQVIQPYEVDIGDDATIYLRSLLFGGAIPVASITEIERRRSPDVVLLRPGRGVREPSHAAQSANRRFR